MRPDTQEALVMREAQEVEGAPCRGPVPPSCAARPCAEAFTPSGTAGAEEAGPERLCQAGSHRGPGGGHGGGGEGAVRERPHCILVFVPEAAKRPALPARSAPTSPHPPSTFTDLAAHAWPQPQRHSLSVTASAHSLCGMRAAQTSPPGAPLQQHLPFLCASPRLRKGPSCRSPPRPGEST